MSGDLHAKCDQLRALASEVHACLTRLTEVDHADRPTLECTLHTITALQALMGRFVPTAGQPGHHHHRAHSVEAPTQRSQPEGSVVKSPRDVPTPKEDWTHMAAGSAGDTDAQAASHVPVTSPVGKTPTLPQSAHDVVWCANRGAAPVQPVVLMEKKPRHYSDEWTELDAMREDDQHYNVYKGVLTLFAEQRALVKTIKNDGCDVFIDKLKNCALDGTTFRTSTSLLPPNGKNMRMFGSERQYSSGFVWDRTDMDLSNTWAWPSGYYAKTEFNIDSGTGQLKNGREEALVTLEALLVANLTYTEIHAFNEIYAHLGCETLVGVFSRSLRYDHLLHCLGLQTAVFDIIGRWIPAFVIDPVAGVRPFYRRMQRTMILSFMDHVDPTADAIIMKPFLPIDVIRKSYENLTGEQIMQFHGSYGCTESCLTFIFANQNVQELMQWVYVGLGYAVHANNLVAARLLVTRAGPIAMKNPRTLNSAQINGIVQNAKSEQMLPLVGTFAVFASISGGLMLRRLKEALETLKQWLEQSDSLSFRMASWRSMKNHPDSKMMPFVGNQAITNRTKFYNALLKLERCNGLMYYLIELSVIVSGLHHPCLRLDLLQYILGLDTRYTAPTLRETVDLALRCAVSGA